MLTAVVVSLAQAADPPASDAEVEEGREAARAWWWQQHYPHGVPNPDALAAARTDWSALPTIRPAGHWAAIGPAPLATDEGLAPYPNMGPFVGRASAIVSDPIDPDVVYAGFAFGGVWRSEDRGATWNEIGRALEAQAIGAILVDPEDSSTIWVGTGEDALFGGQGGAGLFVSRDGGTSYESTGLDAWDGDAISRIARDSVTGDLYVAVTFAIGGWDGYCDGSIFDAADHGLFRSDDDGLTFERIFEGEVTDLEIDARTVPSTLFVGDYPSSVQRSIDGGATWQAATGLPADSHNLHVALTSESSVVYVAGGVGSGASAWSSTDGGSSFVEIPGIPDYCAPQCDYDNAITADPVDATRIFLGGTRCAVTRVDSALDVVPIIDGVSCDAAWYRGTVHADVHDFGWDRDGALWVAHDGGLARSDDGGETWTRPNEGFDTIQMYGLCLDRDDPTVTYAGSQDNGGMKRTEDGWQIVTPGDGGRCAVDSGDASHVLIAAPNGVVYRSGNAFASGDPEYVFATVSCSQVDDLPGCGDRAAFVLPLVSDPTTPRVFYVGTYRLWWSYNSGSDWELFSDDLTAGAHSNECADGTPGRSVDDLLSAIAVAPSDAATVYTGSEAGIVASTHDGGGTWVMVGIDGMLPERWVTSIAVDPVDPNVVYAAFSGFDSDTPDEPGHLFVSRDGGTTWVVLPLPFDAPVNALLAHPHVPGVLWAGTDQGIVYTGDGGRTFARYDPDSIPEVPVYALAWRNVGPAVVAGTFGRSAWEIPLGVGGLAASTDPVEIDVERKAEQVASIDVSNTDGTGNSLAYAATTDVDWLIAQPDVGFVGGAFVDQVRVSVVPQKKRGELDATVFLDADNGDHLEIPVHVLVTRRSCSCDDGGVGWGGLAALGVVGGLASRRRRTTR